MNDKYTRLCGAERIVIANMKQAGKKQQEIAEALGRSQGAISKELSRNHGQRGYRPVQADRFARERKAGKASRPTVMAGVVKEEVEARLRLNHSPDQISKTMAMINLRVSHETIYQHVARDRKAGGTLASHLRINGKRRYRRRNTSGRAEKIPNRVDIELRPPVVCHRERFGDWEADLIQGGGGSGFLVSLYERKSRVGLLHLMPDKSSAEALKGIVSLLHGKKVHTITYDNGLEFARHGLVNELLDCESYFCKPYHSWEKGGVENYNGLVRQYFPKGSNFGAITPDRLLEVQEEINNRPRRSLGYLSPNDFLDELGADQAPSPGGPRGTARFHSRTRSARPSVPSRRSAEYHPNNTSSQTGEPHPPDIR